MTAPMPTDDEFRELVRNVLAWAPEADPLDVERAIRQAWGLPAIDHHDMLPLAFVGAMLRAEIPADHVVQIVAMAKMLLTSMRRWQPPSDTDTPV